MKSIGIEICYSRSGGDRFVQAERLAAEYVAYLLKNMDGELIELKSTKTGVVNIAHTEH